MLCARHKPGRALLLALAACAAMGGCALTLDAQRPSEADFSRIQAGMSGAEVRLLLGPPARVWAVRYRSQTIWSYRYGQPCQLFHVGLTPQGAVDDTSYGPDPACERDEMFMGTGRGRH